MIYRVNAEIIVQADTEMGARLAVEDMCSTATDHNPYIEDWSIDSVQEME